MHGPTACVPASITKVQRIFPRNLSEAQLIPVKLKRKLEYKGHYNFQKISPERIKAAFLYLTEHNLFYKDLVFDENWLENVTDDLVDNCKNVVDNVDICSLKKIQSHCHWHLCILGCSIFAETHTSRKNESIECWLVQDISLVALAIWQVVMSLLCNYCQ